jgi:hypothetical protein
MGLVLGPCPHRWDSPWLQWAFRRSVPVAQLTFRVDALRGWVGGRRWCPVAFECHREPYNRPLPLEP